MLRELNESSIRLNFQNCTLILWAGSTCSLMETFSTCLWKKFILPFNKLITEYKIVVCCLGIKSFTSKSHPDQVKHILK